MAPMLTVQLDTANTCRLSEGLPVNWAQRKNRTDFYFPKLLQGDDIHTQYQRVKSRLS
jgi:hypothetical protein